MPKRATYENTDLDEESLDDLMGIEPEPVDLADPFAGLTPCGECGGTGERGRTKRSGNPGFCEACNGIGYPGISIEPTQARPGSDEKISILSRRYLEGLPLFHPLDKRDHS